MDRSGEYSGPSPDDYANVLALNTAFIKATSDLKGPQRGRLATAPFLLFSFRENDLGLWENLLAENKQVDLLPAVGIEDPELRRIQTAAIGFLWQLSRNNPYAARVISGATIAWCEGISELPLVTLLERVGARGDLMLSRLDLPAELGARLLGDGTSSLSVVRRSSQIAALQSLLTGAGTDNKTRLSAAACRMGSSARVFAKKL